MFVFPITAPDLLAVWTAWACTAVIAWIFGGSGFGCCCCCCCWGGKLCAGIGPGFVIVVIVVGIINVDMVNIFANCFSLSLLRSLFFINNRIFKKINTDFALISSSSLHNHAQPTTDTGYGNFVIFPFSPKNVARRKNVVETQKLFPVPLRGIIDFTPKDTRAPKKIINSSFLFAHQKLKKKKTRNEKNCGKKRIFFPFYRVIRLNVRSDALFFTLAANNEKQTK